ncbi:hypothetical protein [Spirochaeta dissipatitropha]
MKHRILIVFLLLFSTCIVAISADTPHTSILFVDLAQEDGKAVIDQQIEKGLVPIGIEQADGTVYMLLFSSREQVGTDRYEIAVYPHNEVQQRLSARLQNGWTPVGFDMQENAAVFLYLEQESYTSRMNVVDIAIDPDALNENFSALFNQGFRPMDISIYNDRVYILSLDSALVTSRQGLIQAFPIDPELSGQGIQQTVDQGFTPWGLAIHRDEIFMLFLD